MKKKFIMALVFLLYCMPAYASPLQDYSKGRASVDVNWKPDSFRGGENKWEYGATVGLGGRWALNYRQMNFSPKYNGSTIDAGNKEVNLLYKINDDIQVLAGCSMTERDGNGQAVADDTMGQVGVVVTKSIGHSTKLFTLMSIGSHGDNVECGLSWQLKKDLELTTTYRHLEYDWGHGEADFRGFGAGLTFKI